MIMSNEDFLSEEERDLLLHAAEKGELRLFENDQAKWVLSGSKHFIDPNDPLFAALYVEGLESLCKRRFARYGGGELYELTVSGFKVARSLREGTYQAQLQAKNEVIAVYREQNARMDIIVNTLAQTNLSAKLAHKPVKILFLAANPKDTDRLRLDEEIREIDHALQQTKFRDKFDLAPHLAVRLAELQGLLLRHEPDIVHFSGHGSSTGELKFEDSAMGETQTASLQALSRLFEILHEKIRCVVLNACYTKSQAEEIAKHVPCVIGMSKAVGDAAAIQFAAAFYQALGYGHNIRKAFELGRVQINLVGLQEQDTPQLLTRNNRDEELFFIRETV